MRVVALVPAAGQGLRLGTAVPKQFLELAGRTILQRSVEALLDSGRVDAIVVALPAAEAAAPPPYLANRPGVTIVAGGERRQDSVAAAFHAAPREAELFLIHDAARPFVDAATIERTIAAAGEGGAAIAALPARDTVKLAGVTATAWVGVEFGDPLPAVTTAPVPVVKKTLDRDRIYLAQTPQVFQRHVLEAAIACGRRGEAGTDEAALAEQAGFTVRLVPGDPRNIKITTAADLAFARGLLLERGELLR